MCMNGVDFMNLLTEITPTRNFSLAYIILDSIFIILFCGLLFYKKRYATLIWSILGGILYFIVDYGYFHWISHSRTITYCGNSSEAITFWVLLWMSLSYGITNFAFIWLALKKDTHLKEWLLLIIMWWLIAPTIASFDQSHPVMTYRTTNQYHFAMAIILIIGYLGLIIYNIVTKNKKAPIFKLLAIGISVQFAWEFSLLINQIRPWNTASLQTIILNSLIETNLGLPYMYLIYITFSKYFTEDLKKQTAMKELS